MLNYKGTIGILDYWDLGLLDYWDSMRGRRADPGTSGDGITMERDERQPHLDSPISLSVLSLSQN